MQKGSEHFVNFVLTWELLFFKFCSWNEKSINVQHHQQREHTKDCQRLFEIWRHLKFKAIVVTSRKEGSTLHFQDYSWLAQRLVLCAAWFKNYDKSYTTFFNGFSNTIDIRIVNTLVMFLQSNVMIPLTLIYIWSI